MKTSLLVAACTIAFVIPLAPFGRADGSDITPCNGLMRIPTPVHIGFPIEGATSGRAAGDDGNHGYFALALLAGSFDSFYYYQMQGDTQSGECLATTNPNSVPAIPVEGCHISNGSDASARGAVTCPLPV